MLGQLLKFELKYHFAQITFKITAILFLCLGIIAVQGSFGSNEVFKNSPYVITNIISLLSLFSIFASTLFCANVVLRDSIYKMESVVFTTSISRLHYFLVRFIALVIVVFLLMFLAAFGIGIGVMVVDPNQIGPFKIINFLYPLLVFALPNVLFSASILFCTAITTKNVRAIYTTGVLLYIAYMVASIFGNSPLLATSTMKLEEPGFLPYLLDPFGLSSFFGTTKKWTDLQRNQLLFPLAGVFLANRLFWTIFSALVMLISFRFFNFRLKNQDKTKSKKQIEKQVKIIPFKPIAVFPSGLTYNWNVFRSQFKLEAISLFKHIPFMVMLALWTFIFAIELKDTLFSGAYGIHSYPTTGIIMEEIRSIKFALILIIFYAAEVIGREKSVNIQSLIYSAPVKNGVLWAAKSLTLMVLIATLVTINIGIGIAMQLSHGYFILELPKYASLYYYSAFPMFLFAILIVFVQNLSGNKYLGMLLSMIVVFILFLAPRFGIEHYLFRFAATPDLQYSNFNGFGHFAKAFDWYMMYWLAFVAILSLFTIGMWQSSIHRSFVVRLKGIGAVLRNNRLIFIAAILIWIGCGAFIYQQTNSIGRYKNKETTRNWRIDYERKYKSLVNLPQPVIKAIKTTVDLFPEQKMYQVKGSYRLKNETNQAITKLWISLHQEVNSFDITIPGGKKEKIDLTYNQQFIELVKPLMPDEEMNMDFTIKVVRSGFVAFDTENSIIDNGSYIELEKFVPQFGYNYGLEVDDKFERKQAGLPEMSIDTIGDKKYHLIDLETTISTNPAQHVVTVGALQKSWLANGRRYFHYKTTSPINLMFALSSAKYELKKEHYKGVDLSIYYLKGEEYNLNAMLKAIKTTLDYGNANFSKYPFKQFTMAAVPQYRAAATAYPGVIFSAENINFLGNFNGPSRVDHSYAITAHETSHQWWANILSPVNIGGNDLLTESLAKYTEAILIEKNFGKMYLRNYFKADQNIYFLMRSMGDKELPLSTAVGQNYVHYQKGGLVLYAIKEAIGETQLNKILSQLIAAHAYPNPRAKAAELIDAILKQASPEQRKFIEESFNQVITYDMSIKVKSCKALPNKKFAVDLEVNINRLNLNSGQSTAPDMAVDIAFFDQPDLLWDVQTKPIFLRKYHFKQQRNRLTIVLSKKPEMAAIDPYTYLLDDNLDDNLASF